MQKKSMKKEKAINTMAILLMMAVINLIVTSTIQRFTNPKLTETELLLLVPKNFIWQFE